MRNFTRWYRVDIRCRRTPLHFRALLLPLRSAPETHSKISHPRIKRLRESAAGGGTHARAFYSVCAACARHRSRVLPRLCPRLYLGDASQGKYFYGEWKFSTTRRSRSSRGSRRRRRNTRRVTRTSRVGPCTPPRGVALHDATIILIPFLIPLLFFELFAPRLSPHHVKLARFRCVKFARFRLLLFLLLRLAHLAAFIRADEWCAAAVAL